MTGTYACFFWLWAWVISRKPLRNFLRTMERDLMRPVPVVFLLLALIDQLYPLILAAGNPQEAQVFFWMWKATVPHLLQIVCVLLRRFPKELVPLVILRPHTTTLKHVGSWRSFGLLDQGGPS